MKDNLNRKSDDESNKMLSNPSLVFKKTIQTLKKKYGKWYRTKLENWNWSNQKEAGT